MDLRLLLAAGMRDMRDWGGGVDGHMCCGTRYGRPTLMGV